MSGRPAESATGLSMSRTGPVPRLQLRPGRVPLQLPGAISSSCHLDATQYRAFVRWSEGAVPAREAARRRQAVRHGSSPGAQRGRPRSGGPRSLMAAMPETTLVWEERCSELVGPRPQRQRIERSKGDRGLPTSDRGLRGALRRGAVPKRTCSSSQLPRLS